ncbi:MAG TPA: sensor histidine kinase [Acidimicrobiales bacterium]
MSGPAPTEQAPRPPFLHRVSSGQLQFIDLGLAAFLVLVITHHDSILNRGNRVTGVAVLACLAGLSIMARRRMPMTALALMTVAVSFDSVIEGNAIVAPFVAIPIYQVASVYGRRWSLPALAVSVAAFLFASVIHYFPLHQGGLASVAVVAAVAAWFVGDSVRTRRTYIDGLAEQAAQRQRETVERAQRSVAEERLQIARDLHDVVAHSLSVIAVQSGVGRHVIDDQPDEAKKALAAVEATSRSALDELRRMLGVLRRDDGGPASLAPAPGVDSLGPLIQQVQMAGYTVDLDVRSVAVRTITPTVGLSLYRIVQEALTNVVKHAGPASVRVEIRDEADALVLEVNDNGHGLSGPKTAHAGPGDREAHHGIVGMRERVALYDGALSAGPRPEGGFRVLARFPLARLAGP